MKTVYTVRATFEIEVDPSKPAEMVKAAQWIDKLQGGEIVTKPEGAKFSVKVEEPKISNRRDV